jgi:site-specific DNA recombinase
MGQKQAYSRPVYGYDPLEGRLHKNKEEQKMIQRVKAWRQEGRPYRHIAATLNAEGVPTKRGGTWAAMTVRISSWRKPVNKGALVYAVAP